MKKIVLFLGVLLSASIAFSQSKTSNLAINKLLIPQEIEYDGKPELEYTMNDKIIVLDSYSETDFEGKYIRMKLNNKEVTLKMQKMASSKERRVYSNSEFTVTFFDILYGECAGEGAQYLTGKLLIESKTEQNTINFRGSDTLYSSKKCQDMGNG
jgi:hypothetical protein